jgi:hypothetical protein
MEKNGIRKFNYAYAYWGAAYGFANLSKILLSNITQHPDTFDKINLILGSITGNSSFEINLVSKFISKNEKNCIEIIKVIQNHSAWV